MTPQERHKIKDLLRKARIASGKKYMKQAERRIVLEGILALKKLGIFNSSFLANTSTDFFVFSRQIGQVIP